MPTVGTAGLHTTDTPNSRRAWLVVAAAFVAGFVVFGIIYSFGVFFEPMTAEFHASRAAASAFFSVAGFAFYALGPIAGRFGDRFGPRVMVGTGAAMMGAGLVLTALIGRMSFGYVTYGVGVGVGAACAYVPTLAIVGGWFARQRSTALGIAAAGTGCGMLMMPPLATALISQYGWRAADVVFGLACALLLAGCAAIVRPPPLSGVASHRPLRRAVCSVEFVLLYVSWVLATTALFVPLVFLPTFAASHGASDMAASVLLSVIGGMSILGRVGIGILGEQVGILRLFKISVLVMGASYILWLTSAAYAWLVVFAIVLGLGYGVRISLIPQVLIEFFGLRNLGAVLGIFFTGTGIAAIFGPLLAGFVADNLGGERSEIVLALALGMLGVLTILPLRVDATLPGDPKAADGTS